MTGSDNGAVAIGIDFGTLSGRAVVASVADGRELASAEHVYAHGAIEEALPGSGVPLPRSWALQSPQDWVDVIKNAVPAALAAAGVSADQVVGIATDFTACTILPTTADGTPLCELDEFRDRPHAWPKLWKHHAAQGQADRINAVAAERGESWLPRYGGKISSEWAYAKGLQLLEEDPELYARADRWIEAADWIIWQLCGEETRNSCTAGYKGIVQDGERPSREYLAALNPDFADFNAKMEHPLSALGDKAGGLTEQAAAWTGLNPGTVVAVGNVDAHVTAASAKAVGPAKMVAIMGTSTCHVVNGEELKEVPGMCGVVRDGITKGLWGYEAGQSGVGDIFAWFTKNSVPAAYTEEADRRGISIHEYLTELAAEQPVGAHGLVALDWHSGNRSVLVDHDLHGVIAGLSLLTKPEEVYRALVEATAFGTRMIVETLVNAGVPIDEFVAAGGLLKNKWLMQTYADVLRMPITVLTSEQGPALGSAIHAAVAAGVYPDIHAASEAMGKVERAAYVPDPARADAYDELYAVYVDLHDHFGRGGSDALHKLHKIATEATK
ncbi:ribulokinase [Glycomyces albidus]|jgi:L-ribulokinase|uniref:Ribulokinase n=1 Tax=Glycomyces albidus TaxID=2656774 RepID=A0A6L5G458_9ACTN|nr:ribulokinase [Glycomyces albidus]MQM24424.1 ribulokinase [Glycomyces albidus]